MMARLTLFVLLVMSAGVASAQPKKQIIHDAEHYLLEAQHGAKWVAEDRGIAAAVEANVRTSLRTLNRRIAKRGKEAKFTARIVGAVYTLPSGVVRFL